MIAKGVSSQVSEPADWCAPMVVVPNANQKVRICVDYTELNKVVCKYIFTILWWVKTSRLWLSYHHYFWSSSAWLYVQHIQCVGPHFIIICQEEAHRF